MALSADVLAFRSVLLQALEEAFDKHHGIFLDEGTSLFQTLERFDAEHASIAVGGKCATIAAQVAHVTFYLQVLERYILTGSAGNVDWGEIWRTVGAVTPAEWAGLQQALHGSYARLREVLGDDTSWVGPNCMPGALAVLTHTAYHLGEIRQAMCTLL